MINTTERLIRAHEPIGIYNIKEDSNIYRELCVYGEEIDRLQSVLSAATLECFIPTAKAEGLRDAERVFGAVRDDLPRELRRSMILARFSLGVGDFTAEQAEKILKAIGINGALCEYPKQFRITVAVQGTYTKAQRKWILTEFRLLFPAHIEADPVFEGFSWADAESKSLSCHQMDEKAMCWDDIDIYCEA